MEYYIIDRFEGAYAICEKTDGTFVTLPCKILPTSIQEGAVLRREAAQFVRDYEREDILRKRNDVLEKKVFGDA